MRAARALVLPAAIAATLSCAETAPGPLVGASDAWASAPKPTSSSTIGPAAATWDAYAEVLRMPTVTAAFVSRGHLPEQTVDVRANDLARGAYSAVVADTVFPDGSVLAELSHSATGNGYVMRKQDGAWSYFQLDSRGAVLASGTPALCAGCHGQAPSDHVFGSPRSP